MCYYCDLDRDRYVEEEIEEDLESYLLGTTRWRQRDGSMIECSRMSDTHLRNAIAMCERNGRPGGPGYANLIVERNRRQQ